MLVKPVQKNQVCVVCKTEGSSQSLFQKDGYSFARCLSCGLIFQESASGREVIQNYYEKSYYENFGDRNQAILEARVSLYDDFLRRAASYCRTGRLLDIGCGWGHFLKKAQAQGWEVWGIDPSRQACEEARKNLGEKIFNASADEIELGENHFDVITLWNVIDCVPDPAALLAKIYRWLRPGGLLFIRTPNAFFHWNLWRFQARFRPVLRKWGWEKEASVFLRTNFSARTLKKLLSQIGFSSQIQNGKLTEGDAYQVFSRSSLMSLAKQFIYFFSRVVEFLSFKKIYAGSNLTAFATKETLPFTPLSHERGEGKGEELQLRIFLKRIALHLLAVTGYLLALPLWRRIFKPCEISILLYHNVHPLSDSDMNVKPGQFEKQMQFLSKNYHVLSLDEALDSLRQKNRIRRQQVAITFDDGYQDNYSFVYPLLSKFKMPATIFLLAGEEDQERKASHLGNGAFFQNRLLDWKEIKEMENSGISFGSHGVSHGRFKGLTDAQLLRELTESKKKIENEIGKKASFFSYPYGTSLDFDERTEHFTCQAGYEAAFSKRFGRNHSKTDLYALKRIGVEASDTLFTFRAKLNGALGLLSIFDWMWVRKIIRWFDAQFLSSPTARNSPILLVSVDFPPHTDGVSTISGQLAKRIAGQGKEVLVIGPRDQKDREFDSQQAYRVYRVPGYDWGYLRFVPILFCMPYVVLRFRVRKIFAMNIAYGGILAWLFSWFLSMDYMIFAYGYEFEKVKNFPWTKKLYQSIYRRAKNIVTCSELVSQRLIQFGVDPKKIHVLYPAVDFERYTPKPVTENFLSEKGLQGKKILLTVGRLIERKGHDQALKALPAILKQHPDVCYAVVGAGPEEERLKHLSRELGVEASVRFLGRIPDEELVQLYNACYLFVMPSREITDGGHIEGFGIVYLEANACAKPVIGGRSGGVGEAIRDGVTGFLVDPESSEDIAQKILLLLSDSLKAEKMGQQGYAWVHENFNWDPYVDEAYFLLEGKQPLEAKP